MNLALWDRLRRAEGFVPWPELGPDPDAARAEVAALVRAGYQLAADPERGVRYDGPSPRLCAAQIERPPAGRWVGGRVVVRSRVASTNDLAAEAAASRSNAGLAILAEEQTAGRGRRGRSWSAPAGSSILLSVLLFPPGPLDQPGWLTALAAMAVAEVVGPAARIKWPNDVRVDGRKVAGILVERGRGSVVGIGLNVNVAAADLPEDVAPRATSLQILRGGPCDRSEVARELLARLDFWYGRGMTFGPESLAAPWRDRSEHRGRPVAVRTPDGTVAGTVEDLDPIAGLVLRRADGERIPIPARAIESIRDAGGAEPQAVGPRSSP